MEKDSFIATPSGINNLTWAHPEVIFALLNIFSEGSSQVHLLSDSV